MKPAGYRCVFLMGAQQAMAYRADFFLGLASCIFPIIMQVYLWTALYKAGAASTNGYSYNQMILYTLLAGMTSRLVATGFENEIARDIKDGGLNKYLIRPVPYAGYMLARFLGGKAASFGFLLLLAAGVLAGAGAVLGAGFAPGRFALYAVSLAGALGLNFALFFAIAMLGFWLTDISQLFGTISIVIMVISGGVFPLDVFGPAAAVLSAVLPFGYTTQFCVNIVSGRLTLPAIGRGLLALGEGWSYSAACGGTLPSAAERGRQDETIPVAPAALPGAAGAVRQIFPDGADGLPRELDSRHHGGMRVYADQTHVCAADPAGRRPDQRAFHR